MQLPNVSSHAIFQNLNTLVDVPIDEEYKSFICINKTVVPPDNKKKYGYFNRHLTVKSKHLPLPFPLEY